MNYKATVRKKCKFLFQARWDNEWKYWFNVCSCSHLRTLVQWVPTLILSSTNYVIFYQPPISCNFSVIPFIGPFHVVYKISDLPHAVKEQKMYNFFLFVLYFTLLVVIKHHEGNNQDSFSYLINLINVL